MGKSCPRIERTDGGYNTVGTNIPDEGLPVHERKVHVPATMLPELGELDIPDFEAWLPLNWPGNSVSRSPTGGPRTRSTGVPDRPPDARSHA